MPSCLQRSFFLSTRTSQSKLFFRIMDLFASHSRRRASVCSWEFSDLLLLAGVGESWNKGVNKLKSITVGASFSALGSPSSVATKEIIRRNLFQIHSCKTRFTKIIQNIITHTYIVSIHICFICSTESDKLVPCHLISIWNIIQHAVKLSEVFGHIKTVQLFHRTL